MAATLWGKSVDWHGLGGYLVLRAWRVRRPGRRDQRGRSCWYIRVAALNLWCSVRRLWPVVVLGSMGYKASCLCSDAVCLRAGKVGAMPPSGGVCLDADLVLLG